jgi:hypothetical protein
LAPAVSPQLVEAAEVALQASGVRPAPAVLQQLMEAAEVALQASTPALWQPVAGLTAAMSPASRRAEA